MMIDRTLKLQQLIDRLPDFREGQDRTMSFLFTQILNSPIMHMIAKSTYYCSIETKKLCKQKMQ